MWSPKALHWGVVAVVVGCLFLSEGAACMDEEYMRRHHPFGLKAKVVQRIEDSLQRRGLALSSHTQEPIPDWRYRPHSSTGRRRSDVDIEADKAMEVQWVHAKNDKDWDKMLASEEAHKKSMKAKLRRKAKKDGTAVPSTNVHTDHRFFHPDHSGPVFPKHECAHEHLLVETKDRRAREAREAHGEEEQEDSISGFGLDGAVEEPHSHSHPHSHSREPTYHSKVQEDGNVVIERRAWTPSEGLVTLRVIMDTRWLESSTTTDSEIMDKTCFSSGQTLVLGASSSTAACASNSYCDGLSTCDCVYTCESEDVLTDTKKEHLIDRMIPVAKSFFEESLKARGSTSTDTLSVTASTCGTSYGSVNVPTEYSDGSTIGDIVLFVTAMPTRSTTIAYASSCAVDTTSKRPIAGIVNFGPKYISTDDSEQASLIGVTIHEITHAMGFSSSRYSSYIDPTTGVTYDSSIVRVSEQDGDRTRSYLKHPIIVDNLKVHFDCADDIGGELEDYGGSGTAGSHWEKRVYYNEFMTGSSSKRPVYSDITFSLFEASGWYNVVDGRSQGLMWGSRMGCEFPELFCNEWKTDLGTSATQRRPYWCENDSTDSTYCVYDRTSRGRCNAVTNSITLPTDYQYFSDSSYGGYDSLADYCPFLIPYEEEDDCTNTDNNGSSGPHMEEYCENCRCFEHSIVNDKASGTVHTSTGHCHKWKCEADSSGTTVLWLKLNGDYYPCSGDGDGFIDAGPIEGMSGYMVCPNAEVMCDTMYRATRPVGSESDTLYLPGTYQLPTLATVTAISPAFGVSAGNITITITGTNFSWASGETMTTTGVSVCDGEEHDITVSCTEDIPEDFGATLVSIGGAECTDVVVVSSTNLTCTLGSYKFPDGTEDEVDVVVEDTALRVSSLENGFTYKSVLVEAIEAGALTAPNMLLAALAAALALLAL